MHNLTSKLLINTPMTQNMWIFLQILELFLGLELEFLEHLDHLDQSKRCEIHSFLHPNKGVDLEI